MVIGGGIFGIYTALYLARQGRKGILIEKEKNLFSKASLVNQARLHGGYHYPRSVATAQMSHEHQARFTRDHQEFIHFEYEKFYAIDRYASLTDSQQFQRFCDYIDAPYEEVHLQAPFQADRIAALFKTTEYSFDPVLLGRYYQNELLQQPNLEVITDSTIKKVEQVAKNWVIQVQHHQSNYITYHTPLVVNATYAASNTIHQLFGVAPIDLQYEIAEMTLLSAPALANMGLTIMDGQFGSIMPYGLTGLHSLSSVTYTHHEVSKQQVPTFRCQSQNPNCQPNFVANCNSCAVRPASNFIKMQRQIQQYFTEQVQLNYYQSLFTIKAKLRANTIDDGRPTEIRKLSNSPDFYCIFAGKIQSIYEIEKVL